MRYFLLFGILGALVSVEVFAAAATIVERVYECPSKDRVKYTVDYTNKAKGRDGYIYKANDYKDKNVKPTWVKAWASGKKNGKLTVNCQFKVRGGKKITYKMKTSKYKCARKKCKNNCRVNKKQVSCDMYK